MTETKLKDEIINDFANVFCIVFLLYTLFFFANWKLITDEVIFCWLILLCLAGKFAGHANKPKHTEELFDYRIEEEEEL